MLKIRRSRDRLIFIMGIPILVRRHLYIDTAPQESINYPIKALHCETHFNLFLGLSTICDCNVTMSQIKLPDALPLLRVSIMLQPF